MESAGTDQQFDRIENIIQAVYDLESFGEQAASMGFILVPLMY